MKKFKKLIKLIYERFFIAHKKYVRWLGNDYGGFYCSLLNLNDKSIVYSVGIGLDTSFDEDIIRLTGCKVFAFDPTPNSVNWIRSRNDLSEKFIFTEIGIGVTTSKVKFFLPKNVNHISGSVVSQTNINDNNFLFVDVFSLKDLMSRFGHECIDVLKMDIEGLEYDVLSDILKSEIGVKQILVEFHDRFFSDGKKKRMELLKLLKAHNYQLIARSISNQELSFIKI